MLSGLGGWTHEELVEFLLTGRTHHAAVFGGMAIAVVHSTQYLTETDAKAVASYLKTLSPIDPTQQPFIYNDAVAHALYNGDDSMVGAAIYLDSCAACHRITGRGYPYVFPALAGNSVVNTENPISLIHIVLTGDTLPATHQAPSTFTMPGFGWRLNDQEVADVVNLIRISWGNRGSLVTAQQVYEIRNKVSAPAYGELPSTPNDTY